MPRGAIKAWRAKAAVRFNAYSRRERALVAGAIVGGVLFVGYAFLVEPDLVRARTAMRMAEQQRLELTSAQAQLEEARRQLRTDPDAARRAEVAVLKSELAAAEADYERVTAALVPPEQMNFLLERLLARNAKVRLISLKSLSPVDLAARLVDAVKAAIAGKPEGVSAVDALALYKHGVELRVEGSYADLHAWLAQVEEAQLKVLWGETRLSVVEHPRIQLTLKLYTLATDKAWLAI